MNCHLGDRWRVVYESWFMTHDYGQVYKYKWHFITYYSLSLVIRQRQARSCLWSNPELTSISVLFKYNWLDWERPTQLCRINYEIKTMLLRCNWGDRAVYDTSLISNSGITHVHKNWISVITSYYVIATPSNFSERNQVIHWIQWVSPIAFINYSIYVIMC